MKKFMSLCILLLSGITCSHAAGLDHVGKVTLIRYHTIGHSTLPARGITLFQTNPNPVGSCSWYWIAANDKTALATLLTAKISSLSVRVFYETSEYAPWGDTSTCRVHVLDLQ